MSTTMISALLFSISLISVASACVPAVIARGSIRQHREESFFDSPPESFEQYLARTQSKKITSISNSKGQGRATGEATADAGVISSIQTSDQQNTAQGTRIQSSSTGSGTGKNIKLTGSVSAGSEGAFESQTEESRLAQEAAVPIRRRRPQATEPPVIIPATRKPRPVDTTLTIDFDSTDGVIIIDSSDPPVVLVPTRRPRPVVTTALAIDFDSTGGVILIGGSDPSVTDRPDQVPDSHVIQTGNLKSTGQGAATGDISADSGKNLQSQQISNVITNNDGTAVQTGSHASGEGSNLKLSGSSQAKSGGTSQQSEEMVAVRTSTGDVVFVPTSSLRNSASRKILQQSSNILNAQRRKDLTTNGDAVAVGNALVGSGSGISNQDSNVVTNSQGTQADSSSFGQGSGQNVIIDGAVQASSNGNGRDQFNTGAENSQGVVDLQRGGAMWNNQGNSDQTGQSSGSGAATGKAVVSQGTGSSQQNVVSINNGFGTDTRVMSSSKAAGRGIKLSGSTTSNGRQNGGMNNQMLRFPVNFQAPVRNLWRFPF